MDTIEKLGWDPATVGEIDHRLLKLLMSNSALLQWAKGEMQYFVLTCGSHLPNKEYLSMIELHSLEHFLLEGFRKYLPENFISIGIMGCQTGFYLVLLNKGDAEAICSVYKSILNDILVSTKVPYTEIQECGNYKNHSLELAQNVARRLLNSQSSWLEVV